MIADDDLEQTLLTISAAFDAVEARWALAAPLRARRMARSTPRMISMSSPRFPRSRLERSSNGWEMTSMRSPRWPSRRLAVGLALDGAAVLRCGRAEPRLEPRPTTGTEASLALQERGEEASVPKKCVSSRRSIARLQKASPCGRGSVGQVPPHARRKSAAQVISAPTYANHQTGSSRSIQVRA
jgi:hypothetical protein